MGGFFRMMSNTASFSSRIGMTDLRDLSAAITFWKILLQRCPVAALTSRRSAQGMLGSFCSISSSACKYVFSSFFSCKSHLLSRMTQALPDSTMWFAMSLSCAVTIPGSVQSNTKRHTSARSMAFIVRFTIKNSFPSSTLLWARSPAVSTSLNTWSPRCSSQSMESRVVPATSDTMARSFASIRFSSEDLPTFGRPTRATLIMRSSMKSSIGLKLL
mmetsp:Transcript_24712/g.42377  ORF Transcript_24712/g.42377 Transcript_24712/m.42377 type:complete len:216 (+) Transcript_24712:788-1435(+)